MVEIQNYQLESNLFVFKNLDYSNCRTTACPVDDRSDYFAKGDVRQKSVQFLQKKSRLLWVFTFILYLFTWILYSWYKMNLFSIWKKKQKNKAYIRWFPFIITLLLTVCTIQINYLYKFRLSLLAARLPTLFLYLTRTLKQTHTQESSVID